MIHFVLYRSGFHITDVCIGSEGTISLTSGGVGGEFYAKIPWEERFKVLSALGGKTFGKESERSHVEICKWIYEGMMKKFGNSPNDPYADILALMRDHGIKFTSSYWPSRGDD